MWPPESGIVLVGSVRADDAHEAAKAVHRICSSFVVAPAVQPMTDSFSGSLPPIKFLSRYAGIDTVTGDPFAADGAGAGAGAGRGVGSGGGGGAGGRGAALSATSMSRGTPVRTTISRSSVRNPSC